MVNNQNILPYDGEAYYSKKLWTATQCDYLLKALMEMLHWRQDELIMFGKKILTNRKVAWYGDDAFQYTYSHTLKTALPWHKELLPIKESVEEVTQSSFNACLCNLYHHGNEGMSWHSDDDKEFGKQPTIASLSFGANRPFKFRHKNTKEIITLTLENGHLLMMKGNTQHFWVHALPKSSKIKDPRINLTFRKVI